MGYVQVFLTARGETGGTGHYIDWNVDAVLVVKDRDVRRVTRRFEELVAANAPGRNFIIGRTEVMEVARSERDARIDRFRDPMTGRFVVPPVTRASIDVEVRGKRNYTLIELLEEALLGTRDDDPYLED